MSLKIFNVGNCPFSSRNGEGVVRLDDKSSVYWVGGQQFGGMMMMMVISVTNLLLAGGQKCQFSVCVCGSKGQMSAVAKWSNSTGLTIP